jgi:hypothetical protein
MENRYINKTFYCYDCSTRFKKLVHADENQTQCPNCNFGFAQRFEEGEFNREDFDRTYRLQFTNGIANQYHSVTDIRDRDPNNLYGDARRNRNENTQRNINHSQQNLNQNVNQSNVNNNINQNQQGQNTNIQQSRPRLIVVQEIPFSNLFYSPFNGSVNRQQHGLNANDIFSTIFQIPMAEVFTDNFSSNFNSNFTDPLTRIIFIQSMNQTQPGGNPPASKEALKNLKKFKMSEDYCKKDKNGSLEYPTCSVCMSEIQKEEDTVLVPCGHLYHEPCLTTWLNMHNNCPVCRYELPTDDPEYESRRNIQNTSRVGNSSVNRTA